MDLRGRVALVTGGARRVGRELTLALATAGADVIINYSRSREHAHALASEVAGLGRRALAVGADIGSPAAVESLVERTVEAFGRMDVLVNNASTFERSALAEITEADWDRVLGVNLKGPFFLSQRAAPILARDGGGLIVNIGDLSALQAWPSYAHHGISKAGLLHLTRVLAVALAPDVRVNAIAPGTVLPPEDMLEEEIDASRDRTPLGRIGSPEDVSRALLFLVESDFVTGEVLVVDGGRLLR